MSYADVGKDAKRRGKQHPRDARQSLPANEVYKRPAKKRNTRRWCRGVPGREHAYTKTYKLWSIQVPGCKKGYWIWTCTKCGREDYKHKDPGPPSSSDALRASLDRREQRAGSKPEGK